MRPPLLLYHPCSLNGKRQRAEIFHGSSSRDHYRCHPGEFPISTPEPRYKGLWVPTLGVENCQLLSSGVEIRNSMKNLRPLPLPVWAARAVKKNGGGVSPFKLSLSVFCTEGNNGSDGEVAIFDLTSESLTILALIRNKPYDIFSAWLDDTKFLSGEYPDYINFWMIEL